MLIVIININKLKHDFNKITNHIVKVKLKILLLAFGG
jgi:hypothetical protein